MSLAKATSAAVVGLDAVPVEVEVDIASQGLPSFTIVGLPDKAIEESKERVRSAIKNAGIDFPAKRITVNLAPADIKKEGPSYDLPIALGILAADERIPKLSDKLLLVGELALDGSLRHINGILPIVSSLKKEIDGIILPEINAEEASLVKNIKIIPAKTLKDLILHFKKEKELPRYYKRFKISAPTDSEYDLCYIKGQDQAKRAMEIAAAGSHNLFLSGPPGSGKTLLARTLSTIMPEMTDGEILEVTKIFSVSGMLRVDSPTMLTRPFRAPHHTTSSIALVGGGTFPKPGEITLAHRGVLFMDEFPEFPRSVLEALRQPLEDGVVTVSRAQGSITFPAKFILVAAQNPCPCGYLGDPHKACVCTPSQIIKYQKKVSGPLLDRIDIHVEVPKVKFEKLSDESLAEESSKVRLRVNNARAVQIKRQGKNNSELTSKEMKEFCCLDNQSKDILKTAVNQLNLSARGFTRILKVARTIADLNEQEKINSQNIAEALQYRPKERNLY